MFEYKDEIIASRVGNLGGSDADLIEKVARSSQVNKSAIERLAVCKGLIEPKDTPTTAAMQLGDDIEMAIYASLVEDDPRWESNKLIESKKHSKRNVKLISHIDFFLQDEEHHVVKAIECKATSKSTIETRDAYRNQLYVEYLLVNEYAKSLGKRWRAELHLCHYDTRDWDGTFDTTKINMKRIVFRAEQFNVDLGMTLISNYLEQMETYYPDEEITADLLPANVQEHFMTITNVLREIKEREAQVEEFKKKIYEFFNEHGIKSVKSEAFTITRIDPTTSVSFDYKKFLEDYKVKYPRKYKKLIKEFEKVTNKRGYAMIKVK